MRSIDENPFVPRQVSPIDTYKGRDEHIERVLQLLLGARENQSCHFIVTADRGMGKTSLLHSIMQYASGRKQFALISKPNYVTIKLSIDSQTTLVRLITNISRALDAEISNYDVQTKIKGWMASTRNIKLPGGLEWSRAEGDPFDQLDSFAAAIATVAHKLQRKTLLRPPWSNDAPQGILILIDEIDRVDIDILPIGTFIKSLSESLVSFNANNVVLGLAGLPSAKRTILLDHPSALRVFDWIELSPLTPEHMSELIDACLTKSQLSITEEAKNAIIQASEGYPHWLREIGAATYEEWRREENATKPTFPKERAGLNMLHAQSGIAFGLRSVAENYYYHYFSNLEPSETKILQWISAAPQHKIHEDELLQLCGVDVQEFELAIAKFLDEGMIKEAFIGSRKTISLKSTSFGLWLSTQQQQRLVVAKLPKVWEVLKTIDRPISVWCENLEPFRRFSALLNVDQIGFRKPKILPQPYSHPEAFASLPPHNQVVDFRDQIGMVPFRCGTTSIWDNAWKTGDVLAIPHYMLGWAYEKGVWKLDELIEAELSKTLRVYCGISVMAFEETCTFTGDWIGLPFVTLAKAVFLRPPSNSAELNSGVFDWNLRHSGIPMLLEGAFDNVSLWYEFDQLLHCYGVSVVDRDRGEDILEPQLDLNENAGLMRAVHKYVDFINALAPEDRGTIDWTAAPDRFVASSYPAYFGWSDSAEYLRMKLGGQQLRVLASPGPVPGSFAEQPVEGWSFVLPKRPEDTRNKERKQRAKRSAQLLLAVLDPKWQEQFHEQVGISPLQRFLPQYISSASSSWARIQKNIISERLARGKTELQFAKIQLGISAYSYVFFGEDGKSPVKDHAEATARVFRALPLFKKAFSSIVLEERKMRDAR